MSNSPFDEASDDQAAGQVPFAAPVHPQLRLHHLFALTAVAAVLLAINGPRPPSDMPAGFEWPPLAQTAMVGIGIVYTILAAAAITIVAYGIAWRRQGLAFFHQPGHWLLVYASVVAITAALWQLSQRLLQPDFEARLQTINPGSMIVNLLAVFVWLGALIALNVYIAVKKCREGRWKWVFYVKAVAAVIVAIGDVAVIVLLLTAVQADRRQQIRRDTSHWCGVWLQLALSSLTILMMVLTTVVMMSLIIRGSFGL